MLKTWRRLAMLVSTLVLCVSPIQAQELLYGATGSSGVAGNLYTINPASGASTLIGPIQTATGSAVGITGLAFDPINTLFYGVSTSITRSGGNTVLSSLLTINPTTGVATVIGSLGTTISDISFASDGTLYGYQGGSGSPRSLMTINLITGAATAIGPNDLTATTGGGLAFNLAGTLYLSATTADGTLDTLNPTTGARTPGPSIIGAPIKGGAGGAMNAMAFNAAGTLFALNSNRSSPPSTVHLLTIDTASGVVTDIGTVAGDMDAVAFTIVPEPSTLVFVSLGLIAIAAASWRRSSSM